MSSAAVALTGLSGHDDDGAGGGDLAVGAAVAAELGAVVASPRLVGAHTAVVAIVLAVGDLVRAVCGGLCRLCA